MLVIMFWITLLYLACACTASSNYNLMSFLMNSRNSGAMGPNVEDFLSNRGANHFQHQQSHGVQNGNFQPMPYRNDDYSHRKLCSDYHIGCDDIDIKNRDFDTNWNFPHGHKEVNEPIIKPHYYPTSGQRADDFIMNSNEMYGVRHDSVMNYLEILKVISRVENDSLDKLSRVRKAPLNDASRHYAMLMGMLLAIGQKFVDAREPHSYDQVYLDALDKQFPMVWQDPVSVADEVVQSIKNGRQMTRMARDLLENVCMKNQMNQNTCDVMVHLELQKLPVGYKDEMSNLLAFGDLAMEFAGRSMVFEKVSNDFNIIQFLINERNSLRPLVNKIAHALLILKPAGLRESDCEGTKHSQS